MTTTRRTKIKFEKRELTLISLPPGAKFVCSRCKAEIEHLAIARDAGSLAVSDANIFRAAEIEMVHSTETAEGKLLTSAGSENLFGEKRKMEER